MVIKIFIDTHLNDLVIILENNNKIIKEKIIKAEKNNSTLIMPTIKEVLDNIIPSSIIVVNGPGSFTGVRLGVTIAKTLAYTLNIPIRTISSLECMAVSTNLNSKKRVGFSDNNGYYIGNFDSNNSLIDKYIYLSNREYNDYYYKNEVIDNIELDYLKIIEFAILKSPINAHEVNPVYIKKIDVEK